MTFFKKRQHVDDDPVKEQASWQLEHGTDRHDLTPDQDRRYHELAVMVNNGLDVDHVRFARWLVSKGRCSDGL